MPDKLLDVLAAIHMLGENYENIGLVYAFYSGVYKNLVVYVEVAETGEEACRSPLPQKTVCVARKFGLAYGTYLMALGTAMMKSVGSIVNCLFNCQLFY